MLTLFWNSLIHLFTNFTESNIHDVFSEMAKLKFPIEFSCEIEELTRIEWNVVLSRIRYTIRYDRIWYDMISYHIIRPTWYTMIAYWFYFGYFWCWEERVNGSGSCSDTGKRFFWSITDDFHSTKVYSDSFIFGDSTNENQFACIYVSLNTQVLMTIHHNWGNSKKQTNYR